MQILNNQKSISAWFILSIFIFNSCTGTKNNKDVDTASQNNESVTAYADQVTEVEVESTKKGDFVIQKIINGKVEALNKTIVKAESSGPITDFRLAEGKYVSTGDTLLTLEMEELYIQLEQKRNQLDDANIARNERFINDGGEPDDESSVEPRRLRLHNILSGYNKALSGIKETEFQLSKKIILAPIKGWIAEVKVKNKEYITAGQDICTIIDPASFEIKIQIMESEAVNISTGTPVTAYPLLDSGKTVKARISRIRPVVGETGLVTLWARIYSGNSNLYEGMNMRVELESIVPDQVIIPKKALVSRSGRNVVFVYDEASQLAKWKYVNIAYENKESLAISEGINHGDKVIVTGNLNLDHDVSVRLKQP